MMKFANPNTIGVANINSMIVPCMVNSWLYCSLEKNCRPGRASSARMSKASTPPNMKNANDVIRYIRPIVLWSVVVRIFQIGLRVRRSLGGGAATWRSRGSDVSVNSAPCRGVQVRNAHRPAPGRRCGAPIVPRRVGFPALWRNRCGRTRTAPERARWVRNTRRIRLGQRPTRRRAAQHHEALRGGAAHWAFVAKVGPQFGEERPVDGHHPFPAALAGHPHPAQADVDM